MEEMYCREIEELAELRRWAGVDGLAHSLAVGLSPLTVVEDLFDGGVMPGSYLLEYRIVAGVPTSTPYEFERHMIPVDREIRELDPWETWPFYRRYRGRLFVLAEDIAVRHFARDVEVILSRFGLAYRRKRIRRLGGRRIVILGLSVDPLSGSITVPPRLERVLQGPQPVEQGTGEQ